MVNHSESDNDYKYTDRLIALSLQIRSISPKAYALLAANLPFPSSNLLDKYFEEEVKNIPEKLTNFENVNELVNLWKEKNNTSKSIAIDACLTVDAIYFRLDVKITVDNCVSGLLEGPNIIGSLPTILDFVEMQLFLARNWESVFRSGFVFQIQPYDPQYKPFVVHIKPTSNGKATEDIVQLLLKIKKIVKNRRINIKSFAFDGDNPYKRMHDKYFE